METANFLVQDSSWRTVWVRWGEDFNERVADFERRELPALQIPIPRPDFEEFRISNDNGLRLLDSRQISPTGICPLYVASRTFWTWANAEVRLKARGQDMEGRQRDTQEFQLEFNLQWAWRHLYNFNLANLELVTEITDIELRRRIPGAIEETRANLAGFRQQEEALGEFLGVPSPTRQVREAIEAALNAP